MDDCLCEVRNAHVLQAVVEHMPIGYKPSFRARGGLSRRAAENDDIEMLKLLHKHEILDLYTAREAAVCRRQYAAVRWIMGIYMDGVDTLLCRAVDSDSMKCARLVHFLGARVSSEECMRSIALGTRYMLWWFMARLSRIADMYMVLYSLRQAGWREEEAWLLGRILKKTNITPW
jgi:hypothetical protein